MKTTKVKLYIMKGYCEDPLITTTDISDGGYPLLGTYEVDVPIPEFNLEQAEIDAINLRAEKVEKDMKLQLSELRNRAKALQYEYDAKQDNKTDIL